MTVPPNNPPALNPALAFPARRAFSDAARQMHNTPPNLDRWGHAKAMWSLFWRMILLGPFVMVFGTLALAFLIGSFVIPPILAILWVVAGDYFWAGLAIGAWLLWLKYGGPLRRLACDGFKHESI